MKYNIFAGCSYTWGQGLWSYCPTNEYIPTVDEYINGIVEIPQVGNVFRQNNNYPKLVCNEIGGIPVYKFHNGGTDYESYEYINRWLSEYDSNDIGYLIFQTTQLYRSPFPFEIDGKRYHLRSTPGFRNMTRVDEVKSQTKYQIDYENDDVGIDYFYKWLIENKIDIEDFEKIHQEYIGNLIKETLQMCEDLGIKTYILSWTDEYLSFIKNDEFLNDRFIDFEYNGKIYDCIESMQIENLHLHIQYDSAKLHNDGGDLHPSLECHKIIANAILKKISNE